MITSSFARIVNNSLRTTHVRFEIIPSCVAIGFVIWASTVAVSQERSNPPFPVGSELITEAKVQGTISFLASDELGGRGTGSPEFKIAASYVASRFSGAGLLPAGDNDTYYHETTKRQTLLPDIFTITDDGKNQLNPLGLLGAGEQRFQYSGPVAEVDLSATEFGVLQGTVLGKFEPQATGNRALSQLTRLTQRLEAAGAKALIIITNKDSEWKSLADQLRTKPRMEAQNISKIPVVLVDVEQSKITSVAMDIPAILSREQPMRNVIGKIPGSDPELSQEAILFSAHLDHLGTLNHEGDNIYNGADDDASGVTAVLTLADAFAAMSTKPKRSLLFMTFWGEESGLLGSKAFVGRPTWPIDKIAANINIEMIGRPEDGARGKIWMTGWNESNLGQLMSDGAKPWGIDIFEHPKFSAMLYRASDNWSFVERGIVAHSFSAGSLHADYHKPDDEWDRLEIPHMTQVIRGLFVGSLPLIRGEVLPKRIR